MGTLIVVLAVDFDTLNHRTETQLVKRIKMGEAACEGSGALGWGPLVRWQSRVRGGLGSRFVRVLGLVGVGLP